MRIFNYKKAGTTGSKHIGRVLAFILFAGMQTALAQTADTGAISGTVTDPSGAVVAGAQIKVDNVATGETRVVKSSSLGAYLVPQLTPGTYTLQATETGFKIAAYSNLQVNVTETLPLNIHLIVGSPNETVTVESVGEALQFRRRCCMRVV